MGQSFSRLPRSRMLTGELSVDGKILSHINTTFPLSGKTFCLHFTKSCHCGKRYPVTGITFFHMNRTKLYDSSKCFLANRDNFCPYEQTLVQLPDRLNYSLKTLTLYLFQSISSLVKYTLNL